jgi:hypothetical protein
MGFTVFYTMYGIKYLSLKEWVIGESKFIVFGVYGYRL